MEIADFVGSLLVSLFHFHDIAACFYIMSVLILDASQQPPNDIQISGVVFAFGLCEKAIVTLRFLLVFCIFYIGQAGGRVEPRQSSTFGQEACPLGAMLTLEGGAPVTSAHFLEPGLWGMTLPQIAAHPFGGAGVVTHPTALCYSTLGMVPKVE